MSRTTSTTTDEVRVERASTIRWVRVGEIEVSQHAQRDLRPHMAEKIAVSFDPDKFGVPVLNERNGRYWVVDGQHRIEALKIMGWDDQLIECQVYEELSEQEEAELFLGLNTRLTMQALDRFMVSLTAQRPRELSIARAVEAEGLTIGRGKSILSVDKLGKVLDLSGWDNLRKTLRIIRDSYGDSGMKAPVIHGIGLVLHRYDGEVDEETAIERLSSMRGGLGALLARADVLRRSTHRPTADCFAAAVVESLNAKKGGKKLANWWS